MLNLPPVAEWNHRRLDLQVVLKVYRDSITTYRISQLAERSGVAASTLRFYEDSGLLTADRTPSGYRIYDEAAVERLAFISSVKLMGLTLDEIRDLLGAWESGVCASVRTQLAPMVDQQITETERRLAELSAFAARLQTVRSELAGPALAGGCGPDCGCMITKTASTVAAPEGVADLGLIDVSASVPPVQTEADSVIACTLSRDDLGERTLQWREVLNRARYRRQLETDEASSGLEVGFDNDVTLVKQLAYLIAAEQQCCSFYSFTLRIAEGDVAVEVRAPLDAQPLMTELFGEPV